MSNVSVQCRSQLFFNRPHSHHIFNAQGQTPLHWCVLENNPYLSEDREEITDGHGQCAKLLVAAGADVDIADAVRMG